MSFMQKVVGNSKPIWDECIQSPFIKELQNGSLPIEKFKEYMIQDSIYLKHYARMYGNAMYHSTKLRDIQLYYSVLNFVTDTESVVRLNYLKQFDLTDDDIEFIAPLPENQSYIDYMFEISKGGNICEILMSLLPCLLSYSYIFKAIATDKETSKSRYWDFIQDYASEQYYECCNQWSVFTDEKCNSLLDAEKEKLNAIFEKASLLELDFWKMAYRG